MFCNILKKTMILGLSVSSIAVAMDKNENSMFLNRLVRHGIKKTIYHSKPRVSSEEAATQLVPMMESTDLQKKKDLYCDFYLKLEKTPRDKLKEFMTNVTEVKGRFSHPIVSIKFLDVLTYSYENNSSSTPDDNKARCETAMVERFLRILGDELEGEKLTLQVKQFRVSGQPPLRLVMDLDDPEGVLSLIRERVKSYVFEGKRLSDFSKKNLLLETGSLCTWRVGEVSQGPDAPRICGFLNEKLKSDPLALQLSFKVDFNRKPLPQAKEIPNLQTYWLEN